MGREMVGAVGVALALALGGCGSTGDEDGPASLTPAIMGRMPGAAPWPGVGAPTALPEGDRATEPQPAWWSTGQGRDLVPTGFERVAGGGARDVVVDGSGAIWVHGPWTLARLGPGGAAAEVWDVGDDAAFGLAAGIRPAEGAGVWLLTDSRLLLFDGQRFVQDVEVPASVRGDKPVHEMVESGSRVWVGTRSGVWRLSAGRWTRLGPLTGVAALAATDAGGVWAAGRMPGGNGSSGVVLVDQVGQWEELTGTQAPTHVHALVPSPTGGVIAQTARSLVTYAGGTWIPAPRLDVDIAGAAGLEAAVGEDGALWVRGDRGVARRPPGGTWEEVRVPRGEALGGVASFGDSLLAVTDSSLLRVEPDGSARVLWWDPAPHLVATSGDRFYASDTWSPGDTVPADRVAAVSRTEAWATAQGYPRPFRYREGGWEEVRTRALGDDTEILQATDGAVWMLTEGGLTRIADQGEPLVLPGVSGGRLLVGDAGSVWVLPSWWYGWWYRKTLTSEDELAAPRMVRVGPDGSRLSVPLPGEVWTIASAVAGADGTLWLGLCDEGETDPCPSGTRLLRWDGDRWTEVPHPGQTLIALGVDDERGLWVAADGELARYWQGSWTRVPSPGPIAAGAVVRGSSVCVVEQTGGDLVCTGADGQVARHPLPGGTQGVSVASDSSVWVVGPGGVAVLPG